MQVSVIGSGAIGLGSAAVLVAGGHRVTLWSPAGTTPAGQGRQIRAQGALRGVFPASPALSAG